MPDDHIQDQARKIDTRGDFGVEYITCIGGQNEQKLQAWKWAGKSCLNAYCDNAILYPVGVSNNGGK